MLRRRKKSPKPDRRPAAVARSRRRARADVPVPAELLIRETGTGKDTAKVEPIVLVTGFEPFGGERTNPSWDVVERLPARLGALRVEKCRVPCEFGRAIEVVLEAIERHHPSMVLCLGQAGGRARMGVERVAINVDDARAPDNAGVQPIDVPVAPGGPPAYFATLPVKAMVSAMRAAGVPAELSNSAGTYVCNHLMYGVLHFLATRGRGARAGFIHVPYAHGQVLDKAGIASMALETMVDGIEAALLAAAAHAVDIATAEGALS
jgi:pyroglutamyl-peptidase